VRTQPRKFASNGDVAVGQAARSLIKQRRARIDSSDRTGSFDTLLPLVIPKNSPFRLRFADIR
jgi:hypothetical protein